MNKRLGVLVGVATVALGSVLYAQQTPVVRPAVLHEHFKPGPISTTKSTTGNRPVRTKTREPGAPPGLTLTTRDNEPVMKADGPVSDLSMTNPQGQLNPEQASNKLDDETDRVDQLNYFSAFDPSVIPYKRVVAQNKVIVDSTGDYAFNVDVGTLKSVSVVERSKTTKEDAFWGTFLINSPGNRPIPIPSVAPNQRILKVLTEPRANVRIYRDRADNFYVQSNHVGLLRVNVYLTVPKTYFDGAFNKDVKWSEFSRRQLPQMPERAYVRAREVLTQLSIDRKTQTPHDAFIRLVKHFRDFEGKPFPKSLRGDDVYKSIALNKIGVCRHRSFAFVMTATALGIPTRYVYNEAHAFVEVLWPGLGWRRVDLGGAAQDVLMRAGAQQQRVHSGGTNDSLPSPPAYQQEIQRLAKQEQDQQEAAKNASSNQSTSNTGEPGDNQSSNASNLPPPPENFDPNLPHDPNGNDASESDTRPGVQVKILLATKTIRRGQAFRVVGSLRQAGRGVSKKPVYVVLMPVGSPAGRLGARVGAKAITNGQGRFETQLTLPKDLPIGRWTLRAVFDGDDDLRFGSSDD